MSGKGDVPNKKILVVDDEQDLREALKTALAYEGFEVLTANDGDQGLSLALEQKPDLVLLDIMMPKMSGIDVLRALRDDEWGVRADVIMLTASDDMERLAEATELGVSEYIMKTSVTLNDMVGKVKARLGVG